MNSSANLSVVQTQYDTAACDIGVVHLGYGAFHRAHQAVYLDSYMEETGDLRWGIAAVNLRTSETDAFTQSQSQTEGYLLKSVAPDGESRLQRIRSHVRFADWTLDATGAEALLSLPTVHMVTITVTESGYCTDPNGALNTADPVISNELAGGTARSVYAFLRVALTQRMLTTGAPLTICCCDNIRQNGKMLRANLMAYLHHTGDGQLSEWIRQKVTFPCSMVDRITPRSTDALSDELTALTGQPESQPVMAEAFLQWVLEDKFAGPMPDLAQAGVTVTPNTDPYEETKIRVLNGGHTCLVYLAALHGLDTFDQAMRVPDLSAHFWAYETTEVLAALTLDLPFSKTAYLDDIAARFQNEAIADTVARISADGMAKFPIFIRPTLRGCLEQGIMPRFGIRSVASWYVFAQHVAAGRIPFDYVDSGWAQLQELLGNDGFVTSQHLWGDLSEIYPEFADALRAALTDMEQSWPV
jgi:D-arabinitol 4-dehydrogenase